MNALERLPDDILSLDPTPEQCDAYGGCPYKGLCNLGPRERMTSLFAGL